MISFFLALVIAGLLAVSLGTFKFSEYVTTEKDRWGDMVQRPNTSILLKRIVPVFIVFIAVLAFNPIEAQFIESGNIGLKVDRVGDDKGIPIARRCKGLVWYNTWTTDVEEISIRQFSVKYQQFEVPALGGTMIPVAPEFNLSLKPDKYVHLYIHVLKGGDLLSLKDTWIKTATTNAMIYATNKFTPDSIFNNAEVYRKEVYNQLVKQLDTYFDVSENQVNAGQHPPRSMKDALQRQADAVLAAKQAELDRQTAVARAEQKIAEARGDSAQAVISAAGRAEAIRKEQAVITPTYVDYVKWANANASVPRVPSTILGSGASVLLNR